MSDTSPQNKAAHLHNAPTTPPRQPQPGERLFEFLRGHDRFLCELRDHGEYGVEAQFFQNEEFVFSRRFTAAKMEGRFYAARWLAIQWAEEERKAIALSPPPG